MPHDTANSGFGVYLRETANALLPGGVAPVSPVEFGRWRRGIADRHAFILGETDVPGGTPANVLIAKSVANTPFSSANEWLTLRLEARGHHYTLLVDGRRLLDVEDARYDSGTDVGLWTDHAPAKVRDFRLYTLAD